MAHPAIGLLDELFKQLDGLKRLELDVQIDDGGRNEPLDVTVLTLDRVLFSGWMAETVFRYIDFLDRGAQGLAPTRGVEVLHNVIIPQVREQNWSWVDCFEQGDEFYARLRPAMSRDLSVSGIAASNVLRLELVSLHKFNPAVNKIFATGFASALAILVGGFVTVQVYKESGAEVCRRQYIDLAGSQSSQLKDLAKREGRWTTAHVHSSEDINRALYVNAATCGSPLSNATIKLRPEGLIDIQVSSSDARKPSSLK
jgi:hypothetical protein